MLTMCIYPTLFLHLARWWKPYILLWAADLRLPTHTVWPREAGFFRPGQGKAEMTEALLRTDNDYFLWLLNLSKGPLNLEEGPSNIHVLWYWHEGSQDIALISRDNDLVPVFDILVQIQSHDRVHSLTEYIQIYPLSQDLRQGYKLHVTSHWAELQHGKRHGQGQGEDERRQ